MPSEETFWQFKDAELKSRNVREMLGATRHKLKQGTILRFWCRRATRDAKQLAAQENTHGQIQIIIEELGP